MYGKRYPPQAPLPGAWKMWLAAAAALASMLLIWHGQRSPFVQRPGVPYVNRTETPWQDERDPQPPFDFR